MGNSNKKILRKQVAAVVAAELDTIQFELDETFGKLIKTDLKSLNRISYENIIRLRNELQQLKSKISQVNNQLANVSRLEWGENYTVKDNNREITVSGRNLKEEKKDDGTGITVEINETNKEISERASVTGGERYLTINADDLNPTSEGVLKEIESKKKGVKFSELQYLVSFAKLLNGEDYPDVKEVQEFFRPKTRGELLLKLKQGIKCEVVASNEEITSICLDGWLKFKGMYKVYPSRNEGWIIYEPVIS